MHAVRSGDVRLLPEHAASRRHVPRGIRCAVRLVEHSPRSVGAERLDDVRDVEWLWKRSDRGRRGDAERSRGPSMAVKFTGRGNRQHATKRSEVQEPIRRAVFLDNHDSLAGEGCAAYLLVRILSAALNIRRARQHSGASVAQTEHVVVVGRSAQRIRPVEVRTVGTRHEEHVEVLASEVVHMPGASMDGLDLARWTHRHRPDLKVILTSGVFSILDPADERFHQGPLLQKPFKPEELERR